MLSLISFSANKNVEAKVNFFSDYFNLLAKYVGRYRLWDFENLLSLTDKIIFQIENNPENRTRYLDQHLRNYHFQENGFTKQFKFFKKLNPFILEYKQERKKNNWLNSEKRFLYYLKKLKLELEERQISVAIRFLINYLLCPHDLDFHKEDFKYLTRIILSDLKFNEKPEREIKTLINRIMSKEEHFFPLPKSILNQRNQENYSEVISDFFNNRNFQEQFEGILNFKEKEDVIGFYLIKVFKLKIPINEVIEYQGIELRNPKDEIFSNLYNDTTFGKSWKDFIDNENISISVVKGNLTNHEDGFRTAINKTQHIINFINNKLKLNCYIDIYDHRNTVDFNKIGFGTTMDKTLKELNDKDLTTLRNDNPYILLKKINSKAKNRFISAERFYQRALISNELSDYWHYLECLIPQKKLPNGKYEKQIKTACSNILLLSYKDQYPEHLALCLFNLLSSHSLEKTEYSLSYKERSEIIRNWKNSSVLLKSKQYEKHPIIKELNQIYKRRNDTDQKKEEYKYFYSLFHELYEIRNSYTHNGITNRYADIKLASVTSILISRVRMVILQEIKRNRFKSMEKLIEKLIEKSNNYYLK